MAALQILSPVAVTRVDEKPLASREGALTGTVGLLDNQKANAGHLLEAVGRHLSARHPKLKIATEQKIATSASPPEVMARMRTYDAVVLAIAD